MHDDDRWTASELLMAACKSLELARGQVAHARQLDISHVMELLENVARNVDVTMAKLTGVDLGRAA